MILEHDEMIRKGLDALNYNGKTALILKHDENKIVYLADHVLTPVDKPDTIEVRCPDSGNFTFHVLNGDEIYPIFSQDLNYDIDFIKNPFITMMDTILSFQWKYQTVDRYDLPSEQIRIKMQEKHDSLLLEGFKLIPSIDPHNITFIKEDKMFVMEVRKILGYESELRADLAIKYYRKDHKLI